MNRHFSYWVGWYKFVWVAATVWLLFGLQNDKKLAGGTKDEMEKTGKRKN